LQNNSFRQLGTGSDYFGGRMRFNQRSGSKKLGVWQ
jgi:hypothetical protein